MFHVLPYGVTTSAGREEAATAPEEDRFELGVLIGVLVGEGSFGGDGRQPSITVRMHTRHEALFRRLVAIVPGSRLYGPYNHSGRSYFQWLVRGPALRGLVPILDRYLTADIDEHAFARYSKMKETYRTALRAGSTTGSN